MGMEPVDLETNFKEDLDLRLKDEEVLFNKLAVLVLPEALTVYKNPYDIRI